MSGKPDTNYRSPLARARNLGSARSGVQSWWMQRVSAVALVVLMLWLVMSATFFLSTSHAAVTEWLSQPYNAVGIILFVVSMFYHAWLGVREIIEDYIHHKMLKVLSLIALQFVCFASGAAGVFAVLKIAFGG